MFVDKNDKTEHLDPEDWEAVRETSHKILDEMINYMQNTNNRPVWQPIPDQIRSDFPAPIPQNGTPLDEVFEEFRSQILPYPIGNTHPRFWGWVIGGGTIYGALGEFLAAVMNPNAKGGNQSPSMVEEQVIDWFLKLFGFPVSGSGILTSGCSTANLTALITARNTFCGYDIRKTGLQNDKYPLRIYASEQTHSSCLHAVEIIGLGQDGLKLIPVNEDFQIDLEQLKSAIHEDTQKGIKPLCIIANAGTVNTAAFDPINSLAEIAKTNNCWLHVDGAFGAFAKLSKSHQYLLNGLHKADSLAFDFHKWLQIPYDAGCVLMQNCEVHHQAFSQSPSYLQLTDEGIASEYRWSNEWGLQLSRGFKALKIWMSLKTLGFEKFANIIQKNINQAEYLSKIIDRTDCFELICPVSLIIVNFRYNFNGPESRKNHLNQKLVEKIQSSGKAVVSQSILNGKTAIRVCITNHRSELKDFDVLIDLCQQLGGNLNNSSAI